MSSTKKSYTTPQLVRHGDVDEVTKKGGFDTVDMPIGTPVNDDISNVVS